MSDVDFYLNHSLVVTSNAAIMGSIFHGHTTQSVGSVNITTDTVVDSFDISVIQSVSYLLQVSTESGHEITEIMLLHDNVNSYISEYGQLSTCGFPLVQFSTEIVNNQVRLLGTSSASNARVWFHTTQSNSVPSTDIYSILSRDGSTIISRDGSSIVRRV